jgi:hypothetical protein
MPFGAMKNNIVLSPIEDATPLRTIRIHASSISSRRPALFIDRLSMSQLSEKTAQAREQHDFDALPSD